MKKIALAALASVMTASVALAGNIYTASPSGSYHGVFGPIVQKVLSGELFNYRLESTQGTPDNFNRIQANPTHVALGQFDVLAALNAEHPGQITVIRSDLAQECLFAVTSRDEWQNWGDVERLARRARVALPGEQSGATATFRYLQTLSPSGIGSVRDTNISYNASAAAAVQQVISGQADVAFFVQFPDLNSPVFKTVNEKGLNIVAPISREMLRVEVDGQRVYTAQEIETSSGGWFSRANAVTTTCTGVALFTSNPDNLDGNDKLDVEDMVSALRAINAENFQPQQGAIANAMKRLKALSTQGIEAALKAVDEARNNL